MGPDYILYSSQGIKVEFLSDLSEKPERPGKPQTSSSGGTTLQTRLISQSTLFSTS